MSDKKISALTRLATQAADGDILPMVDVSANAGAGETVGIRRDDLLGYSGTPAEVFNVLDYGATGDGSTDDSAAIQLAINAWIANNGGTLYFPPNLTYKIVTGLSIDPIGLTSMAKVMAYGAIINYTGTGDAMVIETNIATSDVQNAERSIHTFGLHIKGSATADCAIRLRGACFNSFKDTVIEDFTSTTSLQGAIVLDALFHYWVEENHFDGLEIKNTGNGICFISREDSGGAASSTANNYFTNTNIWITQAGGKGIYGVGQGASTVWQIARCSFNGIVVHPVNAANIIAFDLSNGYAEGCVFTAPSIDIFGTCASLIGFKYAYPEVVTVLGPTCFPLAGITTFFSGAGLYAVLGGNVPSTLSIAPTGDIYGPSYNRLVITAPATSATLTIANGKTLTVSNTLTFTGTDTSSVAFGAGGTVAYRSDNLSVFASTTSLQLKTLISDETGSGALVFADTPTLVTPVLGAATATTINKVTITPPAAAATLTLGNNKVITINNTLTFNGTDSSTIAFGAGGTVAYVANKLSVFANTTSQELAGIITDETGSGASGILVFNQSPTIVTPTIADLTNMNHNHTNAAGGGQLSITGATTGTLTGSRGGTDQSSYAVGDILYASTTSALSKLADVATGNVLISGGVNTAPSWGKVGLTTHVSGTLPTANGGTNATTLEVWLDPKYTSGNYTTYGNHTPIAVGNTASCYFEWVVPAGFTAISTAHVVIIPDTTETVQWDLAVDCGAIGQAYNNRTDSQTDATQAVTLNTIATLSLATGLDGITIAAGDVVGIKFTSNTDFLFILGLRIRYT